MIRNYEKDGSPRCTRTGDLAFVSPFSSDRVVDVELNAASGSPSYSTRYWKEKPKNKIKIFFSPRFSQHSMAFVVSSNIWIGGRFLVSLHPRCSSNEAPSRWTGPEWTCCPTVPVLPFFTPEYILPAVHLEGSFCTVLPRGEVNGHGVQVSFFLAFLDYLRQQLFSTLPLLSSGKDWFVL